MITLGNPFKVLYNQVIKPYELCCKNEGREVVEGPAEEGRRKCREMGEEEDIMILLIYPLLISD